MERRRCTAQNVPISQAKGQSSLMQQCIRLSTLFRGSFSSAKVQLEHFLFCLQKTGFLLVFFPQSFYINTPTGERVSIMLSKVSAFLNWLDGFVWGVPLIVLILATGIFLTIRLRGIQFHKLGMACKYMFQNENEGHGEVSSFAALCTALSATIGTGNIVGVATALVAGGAGALFWMWIAALFGMATKYAEGVLAIKYRTIDESGHVLGRHKGIVHYTVGQRKGLGIAADAPLYVKRIDAAENRVVLSGNDALFSRELMANDFNWIVYDVPPRELRATARVRYHQREQAATVTVFEDGHVHLVFDEPQRAITPGQAVALYDGDTVLGGGTIL